MQVSSCDVVKAETTTKIDASVEVLHPIPVKAQIWHQMGMDLIDPLPEHHLAINTSSP